MRWSARKYKRKPSESHMSLQHSICEFDDKFRGRNQSFAQWKQSIESSSENCFQFKLPIHAAWTCLLGAINAAVLCHLFCRFFCGKSFKSTSVEPFTLLAYKHQLRYYETKKLICHKMESIAFWLDIVSRVITYQLFY